MIRALVFLALFLLPQTISAQTISEVQAKQSDSGLILEFMSGEYILSDGVSAPRDGWTPGANPKIYRKADMGWRTGDYHTLVGRFRFKRAALDAAPVALYTVSTRNNFTVSVNGTQVFQNFAQISDEKSPWYRPFLIPVPSETLRKGINEVTIEARSKESVGIGRVMIGSHAALQEYHASKFFWQISAPKMANFAMVMLGLLVFLFWIGRRQETELLWLFVSTLLWFLRNHQYHAETVPFDIAIYTVIPVYATYFASAASAAFYLTFTKVANRHRIIAAMFLAGIPLILAQRLFSLSDFVIYIPTLVIVLGVAVLGFRNLKRHRDIEHGVLGFAMMTTPLVTLYDLYKAVQFGGDGNATYLSVFGGLFYALAFVISFGKRALSAFTELGASNVVLEQRIADTRAELAVSESARQELMVAQAVAGERDRIMQEMHDGIGSNLTTALAIARRQKQPDTTIKTLSRALNDLKITVDSLEPVEGDLVALIGNLRHRMANDLHDAGIHCLWEVGECEPIAWLDAANALHVLRIFQEAIGNVLAHSSATQMRIGCAESEQDGIAGIAVYVSDNGRGFDSANAKQGKGLASMAARARSLHGKFTSESATGAGSTVTLWLPLRRSV